MAQSGSSPRQRPKIPAGPSPAGTEAHPQDPGADTEMKVAAAALAAAVSPPLGIAVAAGAALRSPRVREALRRGTVQAVAGAIRVGDQLADAGARRAAAAGSGSASRAASAPSPGAGSSAGNGATAPEGAS